MQIDSSHHINYLISTQFDRGFLPETLEGKKDLCLYFLYELAKLARSAGYKLHAIYSIVAGDNGYHAHFGVSWLPRYSAKREGNRTSVKFIRRLPIIKILENAFFFVDKPTEAIKKVTHDKKYVEMYIIEQPKDDQNTIFTDTFIFIDNPPQALVDKSKSYYSVELFSHSKKHPINNPNLMATKLSLAFIFQLLLIMAYVALLA